MAQRWSLKEDVIIGKYCIENPWAYSSDIDIEKMMSQLEEVGGTIRSSGAIKKRAYAYEILEEGRQSPRIPRQVEIIYSELKTRNMSLGVYQGIKAYIREVYNSNEQTRTLESENKVSSNLTGNNNGLLGYQHTIDYCATFPMVLQKYVDLKGIKKHNAMCKRIGMKPDTFSAILRGKYKDVKKENILKICVGLELRLNEAEELLNSAGYLLSNAIMTDVVVKAFLWNRIYSVVAINAELYENNAPMLFQDYVIEYEEI